MSSSVIKFTYLQILSLAYLLITLSKYRKKKKVMTLENYVYSVLLFFMMSSLIIEIFQIWTNHIWKNLYINDQINISIISKISYSFVIVTLLNLDLYLTVLTSKKNQGYVAYKENIEQEYFNKIIRKYIIAAIVFIIIIIITPLNTTKIKIYGDISTTLSINQVMFVLKAGLLSYMGTIAVMNRKQGISEKLTPFMVYIVFSIIGSLVEGLIPGLNIGSFITTFSIIYINFTIENPDLNVIEQLNIARTSAEKANRAKTDFLSSMSHEIRTPLNAIVGFSHALMEEQISPQAQEEVNDIISSARNLLEVVNNILDVSKIDAGRIEITPLEYNTKKMIKGLSNYVEEKNDNPNVKFEMQIDPDLPPVLYGDSVRIKQCTQNLLSNSLKYTKEGIIKLEIKAVVLNDNCRLFISVYDTGTGIKNEDKNKIFNKFAKKNPTQENTSNGNGLGLTITKKLLDMMNGTVDFETEEGKGTKFLITINQKVVNKTVDEIDDADDVEIKLFDASDKKVLIVDDNAVNLKVAKKLMKDFKLDPDLTTSAKECIDNVRNGIEYDLIFIDDMMPTMTGSEAINFLRRIPNYNIPTVILTANQTPGIREKYIQIGFDDYLAKPILKEQLSYILNKYLNSGTAFKHKAVQGEGNVKEDIEAAEVAPKVEINQSEKYSREFLSKNGVNVEHALDLLMDIQTYNQGLKEFSSEYEKRRKAILDAVKIKDIDAYYKEIHALKSDSKYLGLTKLNELATIHDDEAKKKKTSYIFYNYNELLKEYAKMYEVIKKYLGE